MVTNQRPPATRPKPTSTPRVYLIAVAVVLVLVLAAALAIGLVTAAGRGPSGERGSQLAAAPEFNLSVLGGPAKLKLSDYKGRKAVVLNFWFPSCPPCREEMPGMQRAWAARAAGDIAFVGVYVPSLADTPADAQAFVNQLDITYPIVVDASGDATVEYGVRAFPTTFFITQDGRVQRRWTGYLEEAQLASFTDALLND